MTLSVIKVASGGLAVSQAPAGYGYPCVLSTNGFGIAITPVATGGRPIADATIGGGIFSGIQLSNATFVVGSAASSAIGTLSVVGGVSVALSMWNVATVVETSISNGGLTATHATGNTNTGARETTAKSSGKYYFEITRNAGISSDGIGLVTTAGTYNNVLSGTNCVTTFVVSGNISSNNGASGKNIGSITAGSVVGVAVDFTARKAWFRKGAAGNWNGLAIGSEDPVSGLGGVVVAPTVGFMPVVAFGSGPGGENYTANFGASSFVGAVPSGFIAGWAPPPYTFTLTDSAGNKTQVAGTNGVNLQVGPTVSTVGSFPITVHADNGAGSTFDNTFLITVLPIAPSNSGGANLPTITGTPAFGNTLTASTGTWAGNPTPTYTYQWMRSGVAISGATASTYLLVLFDIGSTITVTVTATNSGGSASATSAATTTVAGLAPANSVVPVISGSAVDGQVLTVTSDGTWSGAPSPTFTYQWKRGATNVGTSSSTYTLVTADVGSNMTCVVTGTNAFGSANATSNALGPVTATAVAPSNSVAPVISGSTVRGNVLTTTDGTWAGTPTPTFTYQWKRGVTNVGTSVNTYTTVVGDEGSSITCVVTGTNTAGSASATSNSLGPITAPSAFKPVYHLYFF